MTTPSKANATPNRGDVWFIRFDPTQGAEIGKTRPAVVVNVESVGRLPLRIVVPVTEWDPRWATVPWLIYLKATGRNGLQKDSAADCFQVKSVSLKRFVNKCGVLSADEMEQISAAVAICVGA